MRITNRTKAVVVVHMLGTPARLDEISRICAARNIPLIEDTAWGCGGSYRGKALGTWGDVGTFSFDFAKTMTTGEGGMLVFKNSETAARARAWHDHGHDNNPAVPRWEDTRSSSGFNFRMTELQGAVGLAQLEKLPRVVGAQRSNRDMLWQAICGLPGLVPRTTPSNSVDTADALVFFVRDNAQARACREALLAEKLGTKILPEAYTWHFAGTWDHMVQLVAAHPPNLAEAFPKSAALLSRAVSLPINVNMAPDVAERVRRALARVLS